MHDVPECMSFVFEGQGSYDSIKVVHEQNDVTNWIALEAGMVAIWRSKCLIEIFSNMQYAHIILSKTYL